MHRAYFTLSVCIILLGLAHIAATPRYFPALTSTSVWFASGGLAIILTGTLNCCIPCDHVPARSWPLFRAREIMPVLIKSIKQGK